jgi:hypothetical protein
MDNMLTFTIDSKEPIPLDVFSKSLSSFKKEFDSITQSSSELYVKEIRKGSIEIDLLAIASVVAPVLPLMANANIVGQFVEYVKTTAKWLSGASKKPDQVSYTIDEIRAFKDIFAPVALSKDTGANIRITQQGQEPIRFDKPQIETMTAFREGEIGLPESVVSVEPTKDEHHKVLFFWYQACFDESKINTGNKGTIESIDPKPQRVLFADDDSETKKEMTTAHPTTGMDWQKVGYIVDVEVLRKAGSIVAYKILDNYMNDAIF